MTPYPYISIMLTQRKLRKDGMRVPNLRLRYLTFRSLLSILLAVSPAHKCEVLMSRISDARHRFVAEELDWGFTRFSELRKLFSKQEGNTRPTIEEESADLTVYVRVLEDPTGILWHNPIKCAPYVTLDLNHTDSFQLRF
jgi:hypothetical protein